MNIRHLLLLILLSVLLSACKAEHLQYEVLSEEISLQITDPKSIPNVPSIIIVASSEEIVPPASGIELPETIKSQLWKIDFKHDFAVFIMRGQMLESGVIYDVIRKGSKVTILTKAYKVGPGNYVLPSFTLPYQLILISKIENWDKDIHFVVERDGEGVITRVVHYIP